MSIPKQTLKVRDPGLPSAPPSDKAPLYIGCSSKGLLNHLYAFANPSDCVDELGEGPVVEAVCTGLVHPGGGGPIYVVRAAAVSPLNASALTVAVDRFDESTGTLTIAGIAYDAYEAIVEITKSGPKGTAEWRYTLDGGSSWSPSRIVPSATPSVADLPGTNVVLTFVPNTDDDLVEFEAGDTFSFTTKMPHYDGASFGAALAAAKVGGTIFGFIYASGEAVSAQAGALVNGSIGGYAEELFNEYRYVRAIVNAGGPVDDTTEGRLRYLNFVNDRVNACFGHNWSRTRKPMAGWAYPRRPDGDLVAARCAAVLVSTSLARFAEGALEEVIKLDHDEALNEVMDQARFTTLRSHVGERGYFTTQGRLMAGEDSDYKFWHLGRVMDLACATTRKAQMRMQGGSVRLTPDGTGTIDDRDAIRLEEPVLDSLNAALLEPDNAEGTPGHVSEVTYTIVRSTNIAVTRSLRTKVSLVQLGYTDNIETELGYTLG
jgi:hypothetical protein